MQPQPGRCDSRCEALLSSRWLLGAWSVQASNIVVERIAMLQHAGRVRTTGERAGELAPAGNLTQACLSGSEGHMACVPQPPPYSHPSQQPAPTQLKTLTATDTRWLRKPSRLLRCAV